MRNIFLLGLLFLIGCNDYLVAGIEKRQQEILVHPEHIDFGHLRSGFESGQDTFQIINTGDKDLIIFAPVLVSGNDRFKFVTDKKTYTISPGELLEFEIGYVPLTFEQNGGYIEIESDDEDEPVSLVTLEGYGEAPVMTVDPEVYDYGDVSIGCDNEERVTIRNDGSLDLTITSVTQMVTQPADIAMGFGSLPDPPWILLPGQEVDFLVSYTPFDIGYDESLVTIKGDDPKNPKEIVAQYGVGDVEQWYTHQWQQTEIPILDVLWVIDNSGSMMQFQTNLSANIGSFMTAFISTGADYRMAVITTDRSTFSTIIDPGHLDPEGALSGLVVTGVTGSGYEKGIEMAYNSLSDSSAAGPGGAFLREDAKLIVIFVSDEPDLSVGGWNAYIHFFDTIKPAGSFIPYGVIGDYPSGCQYQYGTMLRTIQFGLGYWDLIDYYSGSWYSICAPDWGVQLQDMADQVTARKTFYLEEDDPIEPTITVYVNGQLTVDWIYDTALNAVVFNMGTEPAEGQTVDIEYATWGC